MAYIDAEGILLPELTIRPDNYCLERLMRKFIKSENGESSKSARDLLNSASPSRMRTDGSDSRLIFLDGSTFQKDLHTEEIKRFAKSKGWKQPSLEDALRLFSVISFRDFRPDISSVVVLHQPIKDSVLGINRYNGRHLLVGHKVDIRKKGWYCTNVGFVFRVE